VLLEAKQVSVSFGGVHAVRDVNLCLEAGELLGVIGPNGAGKTTLLDAISGYVNARGTVELTGVGRIDQLPPHRRARAGMVRTWQSVELFVGMTVEENIRVGYERLTPGRFLRSVILPSQRQVPQRVSGIMQRLSIGELASRLVGDLTPGQAQLVGLARAMASEPKVLLLDEPAAGLDTRESQSLAAQIRKLVDSGIGVILVEHDMDLIFSVCDRVQVMQMGQTISVGSVSDVRNDPVVRAAYLGMADDEADDGQPRTEVRIDG
jgi:branched-chain amino acid transport system ATP-binding protein